MDRIKESFFINNKSKEIYSHTVWCRRYIKNLNSEETKNVILNDSPEVFINYERNQLTLISEQKVKSLWESDFKNHIAQDSYFDLQKFERGYCYLVELWKAKYGKKVLVLRYFH